MWPPLLMLDPPCAKSALDYRWNRRDGAHRRVRRHALEMETIHTTLSSVLCEQSIGAATSPSTRTLYPVQCVCVTVCVSV